MEKVQQILHTLSDFGDAITERSERSEAEGISWDRFGSLAVYTFSVYGISTFFMALFLNRTRVIGQSSGFRTPSPGRSGLINAIKRLPLSQTTILALLRLLAVALLLAQTLNIFVALSVIGRNQKPNCISRLTRWIPSDKFQYDPESYPANLAMAMPRHEVRFGPTSDMLWPVFLSVCFSLFVETFASALTNKKPYLEGGITLFELSFAIQEMSSGFFFLSKNYSAKRPTEQLLMVCLFAIADHAINHLGALLYSNKYRLIPSAVLSTCFVWYFVSNLVSGDVLQFPMEIFVVYLGLSVTLFITTVCILIFALTVFTKGARIDELNFASFLVESDQEQEFFSKYLGVNLSQDFYTAVMNIGLVAVTLAGKSSYITEYNTVSTPSHTWIELSIWEQFSASMSRSEPSSDSSLEDCTKLERFMEENDICGYVNVISNPTKRMISGASKESTPDSAYTLEVRLKYFKETLLRFAELLRWFVYEVVICRTLRRLFGKRVPEWPEDQSTEAVNRAKARAPRFVRHLVKERISPEPRVSLLDFTNEDLDNRYAEILRNHDLDEQDDSPDFIGDLTDLSEAEESDADVLDLTSSVYNDNDAINELMSAETFVELIEDKEILHRHMSYERGIMTRSRFRALVKTLEPKDQKQQLIDLMLSTRQAAEPKDDIDSRLACVICRVEPREIITWPCKCFAICEGCRLSLVTKGIKGCLCCRRNVEGVSRVYLP